MPINNGSVVGKSRHIAKKIREISYENIKIILCRNWGNCRLKIRRVCSCELRLYLTDFAFTLILGNFDFYMSDVMNRRDVTPLKCIISKYAYKCLFIWTQKILRALKGSRVVFKESFDLLKFPNICHAKAGCKCFRTTWTFKCPTWGTEGSGFKIFYSLTL
jgi:hypothetical protein